MPRPGVTLPVVEYLNEMPVQSTAGSCMVMDRRGPLSNPNLYFIVPVATSGANSVQLWALNVLTNSWIHLADPPIGIFAVIGVGTQAVFDESMQRIWLFNAASAVPWCAFHYYDIATDTWTARSGALGLAAQWSTDAAMLHCDEVISGGAGPGDDHIYLIGNNSVDIQDYTISTNTWAQLTGAGAARAAAPAVGSTLTWNLNETDFIYSFRGGGVATLDEYEVSTDTWTSGVAYIPVGTLLWDEGSCTCEVYPSGFGTGNPVGYAAMNGTVYQSDRLGTHSQCCKIDGTDGLAHVGKSLVAYSYAGVRYVVYRLHTGRSVQRIRLID